MGTGGLFEVRFGSDAVSAEMPGGSVTGLIQVNTGTGATRAVRKRQSVVNPEELMPVICSGWLHKKGNDTSSRTPPVTLL